MKVAAALLVSVLVLPTAASAQEYEKAYGSTASQYPAPPVDRKDFSPVHFVEAKGATAIFTKVKVDGEYLETIKDEIRAKLPNAHVRRIISGTDEDDQTLMVMWHPKEAFRPAINDYFRVLDGMRGVRGTRTFLGTSDRFPDNFPTDTLIGWDFIKFDPVSRANAYSDVSAKIVSDPDVLEVSKLVGAEFDMVVVYRFSGASVGAMAEVQGRLQNLIGRDGILRVDRPVCP